MRGGEKGAEMGLLLSFLAFPGVKKRVQRVLQDMSEYLVLKRWPSCFYFLADIFQRKCLDGADDLAYSWIGCHFPGQVPDAIGWAGVELKVPCLHVCLSPCSHHSRQSRAVSSVLLKPHCSLSFGKVILTFFLLFDPYHPPAHKRDGKLWDETVFPWGEILQRENECVGKGSSELQHEDISGDEGFAFLCCGVQTVPALSEVLLDMNLDMNPCLFQSFHVMRRTLSWRLNCLFVFCQMLANHQQLIAKELNS